MLPGCRRRHAPLSRRCDTRSAARDPRRCRARHARATPPAPPKPPLFAQACCRDYDFAAPALRLHTPPAASVTDGAASLIFRHYPIILWLSFRYADTLTAAIAGGDFRLAIDIFSFRWLFSPLTPATIFIFASFSPPLYWPASYFFHIFASSCFHARLFSFTGFRYFADIDCFSFVDVFFHIDFHFDIEFSLRSAET
jgi:hypothetical protein